MSTEQPRIEELLDPISELKPCGETLRWTSEWDRIKEARRSDDALPAGQWEKKERKSANWPLLEELTFNALKTQTKDIQLAMWFTEAGLKLRQYTGLSEGLRLLRELVTRFWEIGLYPLIEDGPEDRSRPLEWLNERLTESVLELPITRRSNKQDNFSLAQLREAVRVGSESSFTKRDGEIDEAKKKEYLTALANGALSMDMYYAAVDSSETEQYEKLAAEVGQVCDEFKLLEQAIDEKLGEKDAPNFSNIRGTLREIQAELSRRLEKRRTVAKVSESGKTANGSGILSTLPFSGGHANGNGPANGSWNEAEELIRSGKVDAGLIAMTRLAANETTGRNRFQRKLLLAEVCLSSRRKELARAILEELAEQIDTFKLSDWESSDLVGGVWTRLYKLYKVDEAEKDRAKELFERLCRLDPWQALNCGDN